MATTVMAIGVTDMHTTGIGTMATDTMVMDTTPTGTEVGPFSETVWRLG